MNDELKKIWKEASVDYEGRTKSHEQLFFCMQTGNSTRSRVRW